MPNQNINKFEFPIGYYKFHKNQLFNFQLNRWYSFGYARFEDFVQAGKKINSFDDWKREMLQLAEKAVRENMLLRAAFYYRAAAFEPRITIVIATGYAIDYMKSMNAFFYWLHLWLYRNHRAFMARLTEKKFMRNKESIPGWMVKHLMYITKKNKPLDALETYLLMNEQNIHSELITQDVLLLLGKGDHLIPFKMIDMQVKELINAKSITTRVFTKKEHAQNHCQVGNIGLSLDVMVNLISNIYPDFL